MKSDADGPSNPAGGMGAGSGGRPMSGGVGRGGGPDPRSGAQEELLSVVLDPLADSPGTRAAALVDRAGRIVAQRGFRGRGDAMPVASLAAALRASGRRLGDLMGDVGPVRIQGEGSGGTIFLTELPGLDHPLLLLVVSDPDPEQLRFREALQGVARRLSNLTMGAGAPTPEAFEASLMSSLDRLFGPGAGPG